MSLNNVRQYALMLMLLCGAAGLSGMAQADDGACEMMSAVKKVDYGRYRKEDMRQTSAEHIGKVYNGYASVMREVQVSVLCPDVRKMRISVDGIARQNLAYRYGQRRDENRIQRWAGGREPVQLVAVDIGAVAVQGGASQVTLKPEKALAAVNGTEVAGEQFVATMMITTYLSDKAFSVTNTTDFEETLTLNVDTLPAH